MELLNMDSLITKDMYDVAIPICIMNDGSAFHLIAILEVIMLT